MKTTGSVFDAERSIDVEPDELYDRSRYGHVCTSLTPGSEPAWVQLPSGLWVMDFDGDNDYVDLGNDVSLYPLEMSAGIWIWTEGIQPKGSSSPFYCGTRPWMFLVDGSGENITARVETTPTGGLYPTPDYTPLPYNQWNLIFFTWKRPTLNFYLNAVLEATGARDEPLTFARIGVKLGQQANDATSFKGKEALPRVWNYALTAGQIKNLFESERHLFGVL